MDAGLTLFFTFARLQEEAMTAVAEERQEEVLIIRKEDDGAV